MGVVSGRSVLGGPWEKKKTVPNVLAVQEILEFRRFAKKVGF